MLKLTMTKSNNYEELISILKSRFENNMPRHPDLNWVKIEAKLVANPQILQSLSQMEITGGEPDVVDYDQKTADYVFFDCSPESPKGRRSLCYDQASLDSRKSFKPKDSVLNMAKNMGIEVLTEDQYRYLQTLGEFDVKSQNWLKTPTAIRQLGGAIFADRRYDHVFVYHNGAESYYAARGFRGILRV